MSHKYNKPYKKVIHKKNKKNIAKIDNILLDKNHSQLGNIYYLSNRKNKNNKKLSIYSLFKKGEKNGRISNMANMELK